MLLGYLENYLLDVTSSNPPEWIKDPKGREDPYHCWNSSRFALSLAVARARTLCISSIAPARKMLTQILNVQQPNDSTSRRISLNLTPSLYERTKLLSGAVMDAGTESLATLHAPIYNLLRSFSVA